MNGQFRLFEYVKGYQFQLDCLWFFWINGIIYLDKLVEVLWIRGLIVFDEVNVIGYYEEELVVFELF